MTRLTYIRDHACKVAGIPRGQLVGSARRQSVLRLRQALIFVGRRKMQMKVTEVGEALGRHHSTVSTTVEVFEDLLRRGDPLALRAYRIAIRAKVHVDQMLPPVRRVPLTETARTQMLRALTALRPRDSRGWFLPLGAAA